MKKLVGLVVILVVPSVAMALPSPWAEYVAHKGAVWKIPCGGRCFFVQKILSIDSFDQGIVRALMQTIDSHDGSAKGARNWQFAACRRGLLGFGYSSDGSDVQWRAVLEDGRPLDGGVGANGYSRWLAMCRY